jgi:hypothetical protein
MKTTSSVVTASASVLIVVLLSASIGAHPAFALKNFFACITDISNKDGGDHNLTAQQVLDCFHKEFPSNPSGFSFSHSSSSTDVIVNGHHFRSQILN